MISHLRGRLVARGAGATREAAHVVIDVHGVGFRVLVPANLPDRLPARGDEVELHTSLQVREDAMTLYGFSSAEARELFDVLLGAAGVGPRLALAALTTHTAPALRRAIASGDVDSLTLVPGVGRKLANRLVLELKDRLGGGDEPLVVESGPASGAVGEVRLALLQLGYSPAEAQRALAPLDGAADAATLLRDALRSLGDGAAATAANR